MKYKSLTTITAVLLACIGCETTTEATRTGDAVRSMIYYQTADPEAAANPDPEPVMGYSGVKGQAVVREHNKNVSKPEETNNVINLNIGGK